MAKDYDEIENYTRLMPGGDLNVKADDRIFKGDNTHFADEHFLLCSAFRFSPVTERHRSRIPTPSY